MALNQVGVKNTDQRHYLDLKPAGQETVKQSAGSFSVVTKYDVRSHCEVCGGDRTTTRPLFLPWHRERQYPSRIIRKNRLLWFALWQLCARFRVAYCCRPRGQKKGGVRSSTFRLTAHNRPSTHWLAVAISVATIRGQAQAGNLKILGVVSAECDKIFPDVPTFKTRVSMCSSTLGAASACPKVCRLRRR